MRHGPLVLPTLALAVLLLTACAGVPSDSPAITGTVDRVSQAGDGATVLVTGSGQVDKASVLIDARTVLLREEVGGGTSALLVSQIVAGSRISVWFDGPVAESYPVQGHAGTVLLKLPGS
jgi:hypothetical protein